MTTLAYKDGVIAADSQATCDDQGGMTERCNKLFRISRGPHKGEIVATSGDTFPGMTFVDWYENPKGERPKIEGDNSGFVCLVLNWAGLYAVDSYCRLVKVQEPFYATASGAPIAMGAMAAGATAEEAVEIACRYNAYSSPPVKTMTLGEKPLRWKAPEGQS